MSTVRPGRRREPDVDQSRRWIPLFIAVALVVLLLSIANVQLWRATDRLSSNNTGTEASAQLPPLPRTSGGGNRALLREIDRVERSFKGSMTQLQRQIAQSVNAAPAGVAGQLGDLAAQSKALAPSIRKLSSFGPQLNSVAKAAPTVGGLPERLDRIGTQLAEVRGLDRSLKELNKQTKPLQGSLDGLGSQTDRLLGEATSLSGRTDAIGGQFDALTHEMSSLQGLLGTLNGSVGGMSATMTSLTGLIQRNNELLDRLLTLLCTQVPAQCEDPPPDGP